MLLMKNGAAGLEILLTAAFQVMLRDANEQMQMKLDELQGRYAGLTLTKTDLSAQLLMTEEEKLRVSQIHTHIPI